MSAFDPRALRRAFGSFITGVTVVTTRRPDGTFAGFTANSFSSVSLEPPLLLVCPGKFLSSYDAFEGCSHFTVNVLAEGQVAVSNTFATSKGDRFAQVAHRPDLHGVPLIDGAVAQFSCTTHRIVPAGDHCILMGEVAQFSCREEAGLGYVGGQYFSLGLERAALDHGGATAVFGAIVDADGHVLMVRTPKGLRPPHATHAERGAVIDALRDTLTGYCIRADLGQVYSVFESRQMRGQHTYFLAAGEITSASADVVAVPIADLPQETFATPAIARMMTRFALEHRTRNFALYIGDTETGAIHDTQKRT